MDPPVAVLSLGGLVIGVILAVAARRSAQRIDARRRSAEAELAQHRERTSRLAEDLARTSTVLSSMTDGVLLAERDGTIVYANDALVALLGARPSRTEAILPLQLRDAVERTAKEWLPTVAEVQLGGPSGWLRGSAKPVGEGSVLLMVRDVTEGKRLEAMRRDFVANASHELKTPVASIRAAAETIRSAAQEDPEVVPTFAEQLDRESVRLSRIISDLLDLSRLESRPPLEEQVTLAAIVHDEVERYEDLARRSGISLRVDSANAPKVLGSARDLSLLLGNLLDNAIRYTGSGGSVEVALGEEDGRVALTVRDTGIGIPSRDIPRIFERFYRVDRARSRETGGTGLGLSIVRHVVENHGGSIEVESELGRGTTFRVLLPAAG